MRQRREKAARSLARRRPTGGRAAAGGRSASEAGSSAAGSFHPPGPEWADSDSARQVSSVPLRGLAGARCAPGRRAYCADAASTSAVYSERASDRAVCEGGGGVGVGRWSAEGDRWMEVGGYGTGAGGEGGRREPAARRRATRRRCSAHAARCRPGSPRGSSGSGSWRSCRQRAACTPRSQAPR